MVGKEIWRNCCSDGKAISSASVHSIFRGVSEAGRERGVFFWKQEQNLDDAGKQKTIDRYHDEIGRDWGWGIDDDWLLLFGFR
jgi:hypothetical protein